MSRYGRNGDDGTFAGKRFGRLTVLREFAVYKDKRKVSTKTGLPQKQRYIYYECLCDCGSPTNVWKSHLMHKSKPIVSCGCLQKEAAKALGRSRKTHGLCHTKAYSSWSNAKLRCHCATNPDYNLYGARGIFVCERWKDSFEAFYQDMGDPPAGYSLGRIDNNGPYSPSNCRWESAIEQANNTRRSRWITHNEKTQTASQWARELGIPLSTVHRRLKRGVEIC